MIFHRGFRLRTELYSQDFQQGILKATSIILNTIKTLDDYTEGPQPEKMIPNGKNVFLIRFKIYNIFRNPYSIWRQSTTYPRFLTFSPFWNFEFDELNFYCLCSLQKSSSNKKKSSSLNLIFQTRKC